MTVSSQRRPVELVRRVPIPVDAAVAALDHDLRGVIGSRLRASVAAGETYAHMGVEVLRGRQIVREVRVGFGPLLEDEGVMAVPVWWEDAEHPELFPTFDGGLELRSASEGTELCLVGSYQPPLGAFGRFADGVVGHRIVAASLEAFLSAVAERMLRATGDIPPAV